MSGANGALDAGTPMEDDGVGGRLAASTVGGGILTPFMAGSGQQYYDQGHGHPQMQQYNRYSGYDGVTSSGTSDAALSPTTTGSQYYYPGPASAASHPMTASSVTGSSTGYPNPMSAKEREARGGGLAVANPGPAASGRPNSISMPGPSNAMPSLPNPHSPSGSSGVVLHTDGGRVPEPDDTPPREIPPTYDSIGR